MRFISFHSSYSLLSQFNKGISQTEHLTSLDEELTDDESTNDDAPSNDIESTNTDTSTDDESTDDESRDDISTDDADDEATDGELIHGERSENNVNNEYVGKNQYNHKKRPRIYSY